LHESIEKNTHIRRNILEWVYGNTGGDKIQVTMRVLLVFIDEIKPKRKLAHKFAFAKFLELTKECNSKLIDEIIDERRTEKW